MNKKPLRVADRMSNPLDVFVPPEDAPKSWRATHNRRTVWMEDEIWSRLGARAQALGMNRSRLVNQLLREALEPSSKRNTASDDKQTEYSDY